MDTSNYGCLSRQNKKLCYLFLLIVSVSDKTIFFRKLRQHRLSIKTTIEVFDFHDDCLPKHQRLFISFNLQLR